MKDSFKEKTWELVLKAKEKMKREARQTNDEIAKATTTGINIGVVFEDGTLRFNKRKNRQ